jgi:hypothetical protein
MVDIYAIEVDGGVEPGASWVRARSEPHLRSLAAKFPPRAKSALPCSCGTKGTVRVKNNSALGLSLDGGKGEHVNAATTATTLDFVPTAQRLFRHDRVRDHAASSALSAKAAACGRLDYAPLLLQAVNRLPNLTHDRRPILTLLGDELGW